MKNYLIKFNLFKNSCLLICSLFILHPGNGQNLPVPSEAQLRWHAYEQIMFVHLSPAAWQGREYDNGSTPLSEIKISRLDTDQWCEVAQSWGAKMIVFVAKHAGGFCWWQTNTTEYGIRNIPWKNGKGDVLRDLAASTAKYGLDLGIYVYPGDEQWGAGIGSGGITADPAKQEEYNWVFRQQLTEVLANYGTIREVWFDGNCHIPVEDILEKYASEAVIFQGKMASLRWVGNEDGIAPYPNWYTLNKADLKTGTSTALHSNPDGDVYAPVEVDVPLLKNGGHKWFWAPDTDHLLMSTDQLLDIYYKSVGRGAVMLLNSSPDTSGLIPKSHVDVYRKFGEELDRRFGKPILSVSGKGEFLEMDFGKKMAINHVILQEDLRNGQQIRKYLLEGYQDGKWVQLFEGSSVGHKKIDYFPTANIEKLSVRLLAYVGQSPSYLSAAAFYIDAQVTDMQKGKEQAIVGTWDTNSFGMEWKEVSYDLTPYLDKIGEYEFSFSTIAYDFQSKDPSGLEFSDWNLELYGRNAPESLRILDHNSGVRITRSQQTLDEFPSILTVKIRSRPAKSVGDIILQRITY
jgi:alpha-L-fucosidase